MVIDKIKIYLFFQIIKYFILILFIFLSVAWLLQITRLFTLTNFLHVKIYDIILLSLYLIPNLITVILPFILIFGLLLCFNKLKKDNELISILTLGLGLEPFKNTLVSFCLIILSFFILLNFYLAPKIYGIYKIKEFEIRNTLDFDKISFSNFLNLNKKTILDFNKDNNEYVDIFINFEDDNNNIVYAKKGTIFTNDNQYNFKLSNGFKISIDENEQIEKLEFKDYILKIDYQNLNRNKVNDRNTLTIFDDYYSNNYLNISLKIVDIFLIIYVILFFYNNNLKEINFNTNNNIYFACSCISILLLNQILKNSQITIYEYVFPILAVVLLSLIITNIKKKYEKD